LHQEQLGIDRENGGDGSPDLARSDAPVASSTGFFFRHVLENLEPRDIARADLVRGTYGSSMSTGSEIVGDEKK
jgi:hypothetical protein